MQCETQADTRLDRIKLHLRCIYRHAAGITREITTMNYLNSIKSTLALLHNKLPTFIVLGLLTWLYKGLPEDQPLPFAELLYAVILVASVTSIAPVIRLLVFNEAAVFAESGGLDKALADKSFTPALIHYWFATATCYLTALLCVSSLLS